MTNQEIKLRLIESFIRGGRMRQVDDLSDIPSKVDKLLEYINKDNVNNEIEEDAKKCNNFYDDLKRYFEITPREKILDDWSKSSKFDNVGITIDEFLENTNNIVKSKEEQLKKIYFDFYDQMEEPERSEAKENYDYQCAKIESVPTDIYPAICLGFSWNETKQCYEYWSIINNKYDK